ncbi:hypothetical protein [Nonomuraea longicatena]|uniref:hypothetical protein n=1 Tax=Nonomuraea longicatena TaxID=83682 RepID=UPI0031D0025B
MDVPGALPRNHAVGRHHRMDGLAGRRVMRRGRRRLSGCRRLGRLLFRWQRRTAEVTGRARVGGWGPAGSRRVVSCGAQGETRCIGDGLPRSGEPAGKEGAGLGHEVAQTQISGRLQALPHPVGE